MSINSLYENEEEADNHNRLSRLRGFKPLKVEVLSSLSTARIRLEKDSEVRYNGKNYRVVDMMGSPKLEEIGKVR